MIAIALIVLAALVVMLPMTVTMNVTAHFGGKNYSVAADTVSQLCTKVEKLSGVKAAQHNVLYKGKLLSTSDRSWIPLANFGIGQGDVLIVAKERAIQPKPPKVVTAIIRSIGAGYDNSQLAHSVHTTNHINFLAVIEAVKHYQQACGRMADLLLQNKQSHAFIDPKEYEEITKQANEAEKKVIKLLPKNELMREGDSVKLLLEEVALEVAKMTQLLQHSATPQPSQQRQYHQTSHERMPPVEGWW